ncbi:MAG: penicillin-binding transpeptidase domain-containing protein, partial [Thermodesulfobacteriota bacterium]|nr:penicillin-binding transpeptidase domain-containing protein [Thermodesulfobacteriota bacterium]
ANNGVMMEPALVKRIMDESGEVFYSATLKSLVRPIKEATSKKMKILMGDTVINGTCRKAFRPLLRNKLFKEINLGAKTGTINDELDQYKYDWLTAYALPNNGESGICITVLAVHGKKLGIRSKDLARYIIKYRFTSKNRIKSITRSAS